VYYSSYNQLLSSITDILTASKCHRCQTISHHFFANVIGTKNVLHATQQTVATKRPVKSGSECVLTVETHVNKRGRQNF